MEKQSLLSIIADDDLGLLKNPDLTDEQWQIVDAFSEFILKQIGRG